MPTTPPTPLAKWGQALADLLAQPDNTSAQKSSATLNEVEMEILADQSGDYDCAEAQLWIALLRSTSEPIEAAIIADDLDEIEAAVCFAGKPMVAAIRSFRTGRTALPISA